MSRVLLRAVRFWIDFVVGADWLVAAAVGGGLAGTYALVLADLPAWWLLPLTAVAATTMTVRRGAGRRRSGGR
jgi:hypothetical protein